MSTTWQLFHDSALTNPVEAGDPIALTAAYGGSADLQLWYGSTTASVRIQSTTSPGTNPITLTPVDAASGSGQPNTALKLASTQAGLASATGGAALALGTTLSSGVGNAVSLWVRWTPSGTTAGTFTDLSINSNDVTESPVP